MNITRRLRAIPQRVPVSLRSILARITSRLNAALCVKGNIMSKPKVRFVVASDVNPRDGIGVEIYRDDELTVEIFRDDTDRTRQITVFKESVSLELMEESIEIFKREIPWDFIEYDE